MKGGKIVIIQGLPGTGKLEYALETNWLERYNKEYEFFNPSIANIDFPQLDFNTMMKKGVDLVIMTNNEWIEDRSALIEILNEAAQFGYELLEEIYIDADYVKCDCNIKNKWSSQVAYKNYLLQKSSNIYNTYVEDPRSSLENGAWPAKEKYICGK